MRDATGHYLIVLLDSGAAGAERGPGLLVGRAETIDAEVRCLIARDPARVRLWYDDAVEQLEVGARVERGLIGVRRAG